MEPETRCRNGRSRCHAPKPSRLSRRTLQCALALLATTLGLGVAVAVAGPRQASGGSPTISVPSVTVPPPTVPTQSTPSPPPPPPGGGGTPPPPPGPGPLPPLGPYVHFARVTYTGSPSAADSRLQVLIIQAEYGIKKYVARLHRQNPKLKVLAYQSLWLRPGADPAGETACLPGKRSYPLSWYMIGLAGQREAWTWPSGPVFQMDFANHAYLQACARHAVKMARSIGADGVFFDGLATSVYWEGLTTACSGAHAATRRPVRGRAASAICTSNRNWQNGMTGALRYVAGQLHRNHLLIFGNIVGGNVTFVGGGGPGVWQRYDSVLDGAMEEAWAYGTNHYPVAARRLQAGLRNVAWSEAHGKYSILNDDITNCPRCSFYGMAALLLVGQKLSSYDISNGSYGSYSAWWNEYYDRAEHLGRAMGNYYTQANGLMVRRFAAGTVVVNDTTHPITDHAFGPVGPTSAIIH